MKSFLHIPGLWAIGKEPESSWRPHQSFRVRAAEARLWGASRSHSDREGGRRELARSSGAWGRGAGGAGGRGGQALALPSPGQSCAVFPEPQVLIPTVGGMKAHRKVSWQGNETDGA